MVFVHILFLLLHTVSAIVIKTKIVILGAGAAGVSAGKTLTDSNQEDFILLEAQPSIGGRVSHRAFGNNHIELGANWIYGKGDNPIYKLAVKYGLKVSPNDKRNVAYFDDEGEMDHEIGKRVSDEFEEIKVKLVECAESRMKRRQTDLSTRSALSLLRWVPNTPLKAAIEYFNIDWELSEPSEVCSLDYATGTVDMITGTYPLGNDFVLDSRGFSHILLEESRTFLRPNDHRLMLNTLVTKVVYSDQGVTIYTQNGDIIESEYAICTFSLGVLQNDDVQFIPEFPEWKREALLSFHMTTYTKIFLNFQTKFWDDWQFALYANNVTRHGGYYTVWQNLNAPGYFPEKNLTSAGSNVLMVTVTNLESERIERMSDREALDEIQHVLRHMFPMKKIEDPIDIFIPRWHHNPLFRGSYSNWPIGALRKHHMNLRAPLSGKDGTDQPKLWFAGEAMSADYYGFLHGAWLEGISAAQNVIQCIHHKCPYHESYQYVSGCDVDSTPRFFRQF
ncbi:hypothetical protein BDB01DRAFT_784883 [Pilobolus umbonatus]|nr:hypothetical protein BDB01DRAFT_784883 [Pilobolus umbonatus]